MTIDEQTLYDMLASNLTIEVDKKFTMAGGSGIEVTIRFNDKKICSDYVITDPAY